MTDPSTSILQSSSPLSPTRLSTVQTQNLTLHYGNKVAFKDITLTLEPGERIFGNSLESFAP